MNDEQALERLEHEWIDAFRRGDAGALDQVLDDEFLFTDPDGLLMTKAECLEGVTSGALRFNSIEIRRLRVQTFGDTGVVYGYIAIEGQVGKKAYHGDYDFMDVYARRGGQWRAVLSSGGRASQLLGDG